MRQHGGVGGFGGVDKSSSLLSSGSLPSGWQEPVEGFEGVFLVLARFSSFSLGKVLKACLLH